MQVTDEEERARAEVAEGLARWVIGRCSGWGWKEGHGGGVEDDASLEDGTSNEFFIQRLTLPCLLGQT